ncbi:MAG: hypothetical protein ACJ76N_27710 [Thermoanaerobaculia bacterium]
MKKRLLFAAALAAALFLPLARKADAQPGCTRENYGGGTCGTTCVWYNDQGSVEGWVTNFYSC